MDEFLIKLTPVGDGAVGKTSVLTSYAKGEVKDTYEPTVFDNYSTSVMVNGEKVTYLFLLIKYLKSMDTK